MKKNKKAFDIPGINYQLEALAIYLNVNSDIESEFKSIEVLSVCDRMHRFKHKGMTYSVSSNLDKPCDKVICLSVGVYGVKRENTLSNAKYLWEELSNVSVDQDNQIEKPFLHFEKGSDCFDIWLWFELKFGLSVANALM